MVPFLLPCSSALFPEQAAEDWLTPFSKQINTPWDYTDVHINKNSIEGIKKDLDHYASYGKPLWVSEFACVDDSSSFIPCTDQNEINTYINLIVVRPFSLSLSFFLFLSPPRYGSGGSS